MRCTAIFLVLLCQHWILASAVGTGNNDTQTDREKKNQVVQTEQGCAIIAPCNIWAELKELRDQLVEQKVELSNSKSKIEKLEQENAGDATALWAVAKQLSAAQAAKTVRECRGRSERMLPVLWASLWIVSALMFKASSGKNLNICNIFTVFKDRMRSSENKVEELQKENTGERQKSLKRSRNKFIVSYWN